ADRLQRLDREPPALGPPGPAVDQRQPDVADRRRARQQLKVLEHEPDDPVAHPRQLVVGHPCCVAALERQPPRGGPGAPTAPPRATTRWPRVTPDTSATRSSPSAAIWTGRRCTRPPSITNTAWPEPRPINAELGTDIAAVACRTSISAVAVMPTFGTGAPGS